MLTDLSSIDEIPTSPAHVPTQHNSFSPKRAMDTFRQLVHMSGSKSRPRRGKLADIHGNMTRDGVPGGPRGYVDENDTVTSPTGHSKKLSLGRNLVGSIRSITAKQNRSPPRKDGKENISPLGVPSPPAPLPALTLDLGTSEELLPHDFGRATELTQDERILTLARSKIAFISPNKPEDATDDESAASIINSILETEASGEDPSEMFERSVDSQCKSLKRMISLDAMAERCISPDGLSPKGLRISKQDSATTVSACPSDMEEITRQPARMQPPVVLLDGQVDGKWRSDDPFAPGPPSIRLHGPEMVLPFRPKVGTKEIAEPRTADTVPRENVEVDEKTMSPAAKHRSMVSEVLEIERSDGDIGLGRVCGVGDEKTDSHIDDRISTDGDSASVGKVSAEEISSLSDDPAHRERGEVDSNLETALQDAILDNYDLQVALGGVDITCDNQPLHWAGQDEELPQEKSDASLESSDPKTDGCQVFPRYDALSKSTTKDHDYDVLLDQIGSDCSESSNIWSMDDTSRVGEESLKDAMEMYRSYSAEHFKAEQEETVAEQLLEAVDTPTSPASVESNRSNTRKKMPSRYRVRGGRYQL